MEMIVTITTVADGLAIIDSSGTVLARASQLGGMDSIDLHSYAAKRGWTIISPKE